MAKSIEEKLTNSKKYKTNFGNRSLSESESMALSQFDKEIGFTYDRISTIICFIKQGYHDWVKKWKQFRSVHPATLEAHVLLYGEEQGTIIYQNLNKRKTAKLDHSHEAQLKRGLIAREKLKGNKAHSIRSVDFWLNRGLTFEEASAKVRDIQSTNTAERYIKKYGTTLGLVKFNERKASWVGAMNTPERGRNRSLGLWRYIERYGEIDGKIKYLEMRKLRNEYSRIGRASKESVAILSDIIQLLEKYNVGYHFGVEGNKEWFIYDDNMQQAFFYDLTIPSLSIIIEYHGEAFHPNPRWDDDKWNSWTAAFSNKTAEESYEVDQYKKKLAESRGWLVFEIYSSETASTKQEIFEYLIKSGYVL